MSYIPEYHENYYRVEGTAYNQGKIGIGTINPVQLLHVSGGNIRLDGTGYVNGDLNVTGNLNVYGTTAQFAVSQVIAEDKSLELNVATGTAIGGGNYTTAAFSDDAGANDGGIVVKSTSLDSTRGVQDKVIVYRNSTPASGWVSNQRWNVSGNYGKNTLNLTDTTADVGMTIGGDCALFRSGNNVLSTDDRFGITFDGGKNTLHLNNTAVNVGMTIGHDTNLYRSGVGVLQTDSLLSTTANSGKNTLHLNNTTVNVGMTIGQDTNLYRSGVDTLRTDDNLGIVGNFNVDGNTILGDSNADTVTINAGPVNLPNATSAADALVLGADANLYRSAADTLRTDDSLVVDGNLTVNGGSTSINSTTITLGDANTDSVTINAGPISLVNATAAADALEFGAGANLANLYRSTNDVLRTDDSLIVGTNLTVNGSTDIVSNLTIGQNLTVTGNAILGTGANSYTNDTIGISGRLAIGITQVSGASQFTVQANSVNVASDAVIVTGFANASANGAVALPTWLYGSQVEIRNRSGGTLAVYPTGTASIFVTTGTTPSLGANTFTTINNNSSQRFFGGFSGASQIWWA